MSDNLENDNVETQPKKKITKIELLALALVFVFLMLYFLPKTLMSAEKKVEATLKTSAATFTKVVLEKFAARKSADVTKVADETINELNAAYKNPLSKKRGIFVAAQECTGCINVQADDSIQSIIITGYDKNLKTIVRTVIKPPSFVTYTREEK